MLTFMTIKKYPNGDSKISLKNNPQLNYEQISETKRNNKLAKIKLYEKLELKKEMILNKISCLSFSETKLKEQLESELKAIDNEILDIDGYINVKNLRISVARAKNIMKDILLSNNFDFFVTLTFGNKDKRHNDEYTRGKLKVWFDNIRRHCPNIYYIAVPEYHKKGALHFHLLIGGVTMEELKCINSGKVVKKGVCKGDLIYNVGLWNEDKYGFSTLTKIRNVDACCNYVLKYITKQCTDERFFGKKRYYPSRNLVRPDVTKDTFPPNMTLTLNSMEEIYENLSSSFDLSKLLVAFFSPRKQFVILESCPERDYYKHGEYSDEFHTDKLFEKQNEYMLSQIF